MAEGFNVDEPINYFNNANPTAPNPAPGFVTDVAGENNYTVRVQNANDSTRLEEHVGQLGVEGTDPDRYIEPREDVGYEPPVLGDGGGAIGG